MVNTMVNTQVPDFEDEQFSAPASERPPIAQIINPRFTKKGIAPYGFALTKKDAEACSFSVPDGWEFVEHEFASGSKETVLMTLKPRLLIIAKTPTYLKSREKGEIRGKIREKGELIGEMRNIPEYWQNKHLYKPASWSWCYVLNEENESCNSVPIRISLGGASGASFNASWLQYQTKELPRGGFCCEMEKIYAQSRNQDYKPMGELFHAHCVYEPIFEADERGTKPDTALVSVVNSYTPASMASLITNGSQLSEKIKLSRETVKDWKPQSKDALNEAEEDDGFSGRPKKTQQVTSDSYNDDDFS